MAVGGGTYSPRHKGHFSGPPQWNRSHRLHVCRVPTSRKERTKAVGDFGFSGAAASSCGTVTTRRGVAWRRGINSIHSLYCAPRRVCVGLRTARLGQMMRPDAVPPPRREPLSERGLRLGLPTRHTARAAAAPRTVLTTRAFRNVQQYQK